MANAQRGEVALTHSGKTYVFSFSMNALCELEELLEMNVVAISQELSNGAAVRMKTVRAVVWGALRDNHSEMTLEDAGDLATAAGVFAVMDLAGTAFSRSFPDKKKEGKDAPSHPPKKLPAGSG